MCCVRGVARLAGPERRRKAEGGRETERERERGSEGARERGSEEAREQGSGGARERGREGAGEGGREGARERGGGNEGGSEGGKEGKERAGENRRGSGISRRLANRRYLGEQTRERIQRRQAQAHGCTNTQCSHPAPAQVCCRAACYISALRMAQTRAMGTAAASSTGGRSAARCTHMRACSSGEAPNLLSLLTYKP
jgi:hypothetical protein